MEEMKEEDIDIVIQESLYTAKDICRGIEAAVMMLSLWPRMWAAPAAAAAIVSVIQTHVAANVY